MISILDWFRDARDYLADLLRGRGRGNGLHVLPAGMRPRTWLSSLSWDEPSPRLFYGPGMSVDLPCMDDGYYPGAPLEPLPPMNLPGPVALQRAGEPTPNQRQALWQPHVLPSRVIAALENASPEDTATSPATLPQWVRDFLTVPLASLDLLERADKIGLAVRQA